MNDNDGVITHDSFETNTGGRFDALDVTADVKEVVGRSGITTGTALVFSPHTTCCVLISSDANDAVGALARAMEALAPEDGYYAHDDLAIRTENLVQDEPANAPAHILHVVLGKASEAIPVAGGDLCLADDQRVFFVELDSPRPRRYLVQVVGE